MSLPQRPDRGSRDYLDEDNQTPNPFQWTATADMLLDKVASVCKRISNSGHSGAC